MQKSFYIYTYGCQMNVHDSERMMAMLTDSGYTRAEAPENADLLIFNTCAIREKAEQKFYSQLGRTKLLKKRHKGLKIAVAGCVAQETKERLLQRAPYVDYLLGPQNIHLISDLVSGKSRSGLFDDNHELASRELAANRESRIKAWVSIMYGCNNFCTYCIVPYTRGREVSRPSRSIISEIEDLAGKGYREITILGQNVNSYKSDIDFPELLARINEVNIDRIRFVTSHPRDFSEGLIEAVAELPHVCEHVHLPIQSGSDRILNLMNRGYTYSEYRKKIDLLRKKIPDVAITADVIAGFPGETMRDHAATMRAIKEIEFDGLFAFKFSAKKGTRAYDMDGQIEDDNKTLRLSEILELQEGITYKKNKALEGTTQEVLLDGASDADIEMLSGMTRTNKIVTILNNGEKAGSYARVRIEKARQHSLWGVNLNRDGDTSGI
jgi:tRNA-2-methylthio-N6-dimethylallyladenosine synthase